MVIGIWKSSSVLFFESVIIYIREYSWDLTYVTLEENMSFLPQDIVFHVDSIAIKTNIYIRIHCSRRLVWQFLFRFGVPIASNLFREQTQQSAIECRYRRGNPVYFSWPICFTMYLYRNFFAFVFHKFSLSNQKLLRSGDLWLLLNYCKHDKMMSQDTPK